MRLRAPFVLLLVLLGTTIAHADEAQRRAKEHFALAEAAERRKDWQTAIDEYQLAYAIKPHPSVLYNIAVDFERLEHWDGAIEFYNRYLADAPDAPDAAKVRARVAELDEKLAASRPPAPVGTGRLSVAANVEGATVLIDGQPAGVTPFVGAVPAGPHRVTIHHDQYVDVERDVVVHPGGAEQVRETLNPVPGAQIAPATPLRPLRALIRVGVGGDLASGLTPALRYTFEFGGRLLDKLDFAVFAGHLGDGNSSEGLVARYLPFGGALRPFLRAAISYGVISDDDGVDTTGSIFGVEGGAGLLVAIPQLAHYELTFEVDARLLLSGVAVPPSTDHRPRFSVPLEAGLLVVF